MSVGVHRSEVCAPAATGPSGDRRSLVAVIVANDGMCRTRIARAPLRGPPLPRSATDQGKVTLATVDRCPRPCAVSSAATSKAYVVLGARLEITALMVDASTV